MPEFDWEDWGKSWVMNWPRKIRRFFLGFGLFLVLVGVFLLLRDLGYLPHVSVFAVLAIGFGLWILVSALTR